MKKNRLPQISYWQKRIFSTLWITYGSFYLCRANMSIALPGIMKEFGYSRTDVGMIGSALFVAYAIGQFINGQLGDKFGARKFITLGIIVSAALNIAFGFTAALPVMIITWGANGYFQSMGWPPSVKTLANWFPSKERGRMSGLFGSSGLIGNVVSWLIAGYLCLHYGWRSVFWVPALLFSLSGIQFYLRCRNSPEDVGLPSVEQYEKKQWLSIQDKAEIISNEKNEGKPENNNHLGFSFTIKQTIGNPKLWRVGLAYLSLSFIVVGFSYWIPVYMSEVQGISISKIASRAIVFPLAGSLGALTAGWISDRFFKSKRTPIIILMSALAGVFLLVYVRISIENQFLSLGCLSLIGFMAFGAHITMATAIPMDYGTRKAASSAAGFIDSLGYAGAAIVGVGVGWLVDTYGWNSAFYFWASGAFISCLLMLRLWGYAPPKGKYM